MVILWYCILPTELVFESHCLNDTYVEKVNRITHSTWAWSLLKFKSLLNWVWLIWDTGSSETIMFGLKRTTWGWFCVETFLLSSASFLCSQSDVFCSIENMKTQHNGKLSKKISRFSLQNWLMQRWPFSTFIYIIEPRRTSKPVLNWFIFNNPGF